MEALFYECEQIITESTLFEPFIEDEIVLEAADEAKVGIFKKIGTFLKELWDKFIRWLQTIAAKAKMKFGQNRKKITELKSKITPEMSSNFNSLANKISISLIGLTDLFDSIGQDAANVLNATFSAMDFDAKDIPDELYAKFDDAVADYNSYCDTPEMKSLYSLVMAPVQLNMLKKIHKGLSIATKLSSIALTIGKLSKKLSSDDVIQLKSIINHFRKIMRNVTVYYDMLVSNYP